MSIEDGKMNSTGLIVMTMNVSSGTSVGDIGQEHVFNVSQLAANESELVRSATSVVDSLIGIATAMILAIMILATAIGNCFFFLPFSLLFLQFFWGFLGFAVRC